MSTTDLDYANDLLERAILAMRDGDVDAALAYMKRANAVLEKGLPQ